MFDRSKAQRIELPSEGVHNILTSNGVRGRAKREWGRLQIHARGWWSGDQSLLPPLLASGRHEPRRHEPGDGCHARNHRFEAAIHEPPRQGKPQDRESGKF